MNLKSLKDLTNLKTYIIDSNNPHEVDDAISLEINDRNKKRLSKTRFWIAASIHKEEDVFCLKAHLKIKREYSDVITIIAPRHLNKVNKINTYLLTNVYT